MQNGSISIMINDLISSITGEWMAPTVLLNTGKQLQEADMGLRHTAAGGIPLNFLMQMVMVIWI